MTKFIEETGQAARSANVPVILYGSTLAHAYYQLRKIGCTIVTPMEKERSRIRRSVNFGKLVRDRIPERISSRHEASATKQVDGNVRVGFLVSKLIEEALEIRTAEGQDQKTEELADLFEVFRSIAKTMKISLNSIEKAAAEKRRKSGGFDEGHILIQTGILNKENAEYTDIDRRASGRILSEAGNDVVEIPFSFFGFTRIERPQVIYLARQNIHLEITLRPDRLEIRLVRNPDQLALPLDI